MAREYREDFISSSLFEQEINLLDNTPGIWAESSFWITDLQVTGGFYEYDEAYALHCINPQTAKVKIEQQNSLNVAVTSEIQIMMDVEPIKCEELADNSYNTEVEERIIKVTMDEESEPICNEVMEPLEQIPLDKNCLLLDMQEPTMNETITYYEAVMEPTHYYLENMDQNNENYSDPLSHEDKNVLPMDSEYYLGVKKKTQQGIGRQVSFNLLTSQVLGYNEPCQWKQRNSTHMGPVHCVNRKRKKKRTSQGLSRIELQHVKMKNLQPLLNLFRLLVHYII